MLIDIMDDPWECRSFCRVHLVACVMPRVLFHLLKVLEMPVICNLQYFYSAVCNYISKLPILMHSFLFASDSPVCVLDFYVQPFFHRSPTGLTMNCKLVHLTRFFVEWRPKWSVCLEQLTSHLSQLPMQRGVFKDLRNALVSNFSKAKY
jgi:hypothetical protein